MAKKSAPRVGLDEDVEQLMQVLAIYHGGNLTAAVNYALRLAVPAILRDLQSYHPSTHPLKTLTVAASERFSIPATEDSASQPSNSMPCSPRTNAERLQGARL